jgi:hypothetical protein
MTMLSGIGIAVRVDPRENLVIVPRLPLRVLQECRSSAWHILSLL